MDKQEESLRPVPSNTVIKKALIAQWGLPDDMNISEIKKTAVGRMVFRIDTKDKSYALKIYAPSRKKAIVEKDLYLLLLLEKKAFPACLLRKTSRGEGYGTIDDSYAYVYDWIEGKHPEPTAETFEKLGDITGRLHIISEPYPYASDFRPANEIQKLLVTAKSKGIDQKHIDLLLSIRDLSQLPQGMIHTDIGPHNSLECPNGQIVVIDWEDAGLGPMVIDIGWELEQCLSDESLFETEKAKAFLRGYQEHRTLTLEEKNHAYDAALFFAFLYWMDEQKDFGTRRINWFAEHRSEFEQIFE